MNKSRDTIQKELDEFREKRNIYWFILNGPQNKEVNEQFLF